VGDVIAHKRDLRNWDATAARSREPKAPAWQAGSFTAKYCTVLPTMTHCCCFAGCCRTLLMLSTPLVQDATCFLPTTRTSLSARRWARLWWATPMSVWLLCGLLGLIRANYCNCMLNCMTSCHSCHSLADNVECGVLLLGWWFSTQVGVVQAGWMQGANAGEDG
jgi:hypothetical protein